MKDIRFFSSCAALVLLFIFIGSNSAIGQNTTQPETKVDKAREPLAKPGSIRPPFCDLVLPALKTKLQKEADAACKTAQSCTYCTDRQSNTDIYATLIVQPKQNSRCKTLEAVAIVPTEGEAGPAFNFDVLQSACPRSGVSAEVTFPDAQIKPGDFSYEWDIDGKVASRESKLDCGCGNKAIVKVTNTRTKQTVTKAMTLPEACKSGAGSKE